VTLEHTRNKFSFELDQIISGKTPVRQRYSPKLRAAVVSLIQRGHSLPEIRTAFGLKGNELGTIMKKQNLPPASSTKNFVEIKPELRPPQDKNHGRFLPEAVEINIGVVCIKIGY
jgi:hypothetical protein